MFKIFEGEFGILLLNTFVGFERPCVKNIVRPFPSSMKKVCLYYERCYILGQIAAYQYHVVLGVCVKSIYSGSPVYLRSGYRICCNI